MGQKKDEMRLMNYAGNVDWRLGTEEKRETMGKVDREEGRRKQRVRRKRQSLLSAFQREQKQTTRVKMNAKLHDLA